MSVLVATPFRMSMNPRLLARADELYARLTCSGIERALFGNNIKVGGGKFWPNAIARNALLDFYLKSHHQFVLWLDADLVDYPPDLIQRMMRTMADHNASAVAPMVLIEGTDKFYDFNGFTFGGQKFNPNPPYADTTERVFDVETCGTCYLIDAQVYRSGARYRPYGNDIEHVSLFGLIRTLGRRVVCDRGIVVQHAYLPAYGEVFH